MSGPADPKPVRAPDDSSAEERLRFRVAVLAADRGCVAHDDPSDCDGDVQAHHVLSRQRLRRAGLSARAWDPDNGAAVCYRAHRRHHSRVEPIALARLPRRCVLFAIAHDLLYVLEREYAPSP